MKNKFSFNELKNNIVSNYPYAKYEKSYSNYGTLSYNYNSHHISISLESFYGDSDDLKYTPSGTSNIKSTIMYIDNESACHVSLQKEIALHGFSFVPFVMHSIANESSDYISYDEFIGLLTDKDGVEFTSYENYDKVTFHLNNRNHNMSMLISKDDNEPVYINTSYMKSGSCSWYNIFNVRILNEKLNKMNVTKKYCIKKGIRLVTIYTIISEIYNKINTVQEVPFRPRRKDCNKLFEYYLE